jgi:hypothetical protein
MDAVGKAIWFFETHFSGDISLDDVAKAAGVSRFWHISAIRRTVCTIWTKWLPDSGHEVVDAPSFERFGEAFDFRTGMGGLEIWIPIKGCAGIHKQHVRVIP